MTVHDNVWIVDPDEESRAAATRLVWAAGMQSRAYSHGTAFLGAFNEDLPACVVPETHIPDTKGLEVQKHLGRGPYCPQIVFVTALRDVPAIVHAMKAGAFHFLERPVQNRLFLEVVRQAVARDQIEWEAHGSKRRSRGRGTDCQAENGRSLTCLRRRFPDRRPFSKLGYKYEVKSIRGTQGGINKNTLSVEIETDFQ